MANHLGGRARYYSPSPIQIVSGVVRDDSYTNSPFDFFIGTMEALVASGLAEVSMFPGQPGVGITRCTYNPEGACRRLVANYKGEMEPVRL
jgi:hypothetical protein